MNKKIMNRTNIAGVLLLLSILLIGITYFVITMKTTENSDPNSITEIVNSITDNDTQMINMTNTSYGTATIGSRKVINNIWGATNKELKSGSVKSHVYVNSDGSFGWRWDRPDPGYNSDKYVYPIYPEVVIGATPADKSSTVKTFPIRYGDINSWKSKIQFEYPESPDGLYNLAYDIYWMRGNKKEFNVMIWIEGRYGGRSPPIGEVSDGVNTYIHYYRATGDNSNWEWHAFILKDQENSSTHNIDIKALLDNAFSLDTIDKDWIIPGMEFGNEVWRGKGEIKINRYDVEINGDSI